MKVRMKVERRWLQLERKSMAKMKRDYASWEAETLQRAKEAKDLRSLRDVFYELGDRWEWNQAAGAWLENGEPLDTVGLILRIPGFDPCKERYVVYGVMAYSKGFTGQFDHLGDKERIIIEKDIKTGKMYAWSTTGHGAMDLVPTDVSRFHSIQTLLESCFIVAQPGDHAMRLEVPKEKRTLRDITQRMWEIATGGITYEAKEISLLDSEDIEKTLDFRFYRFAQSVIELERIWKQLQVGAFEGAMEAVLDKIPDHIEKRVERTLKRVEGLLHLLWFKPPAKCLQPARRLYEEMRHEPTPTDVERTLIPYMGEVVYSLNDIIEKAKYIKWKSVMDKKAFGDSDAFRGLDLSSIEKEAFAVALEDILREHTLSYIGYPERGTMKNKIMRIAFGTFMLPLRLVSTFTKSLRARISVPLQLLGKKKQNENVSEDDYSRDTTSDGEMKT